MLGLHRVEDRGGRVLPGQPLVQQRPQARVLAPVVDEQLPLPSGMNQAEVTGSSPDGKTLLGFASDEGTSPKAVVIWRNGKIVDTIRDAPGPLSDVNSHGVAVGNYLTDQSDSRSWIYEDGKVRELPGDVTVNAINDAGQMVGSRMAPTENGPPISVPVTWQPGY